MRITHSPKNILVTGGAGFIGANYVQYELHRHTDINIVTLDALTYAGNLDNLSALKNNPRHIFIHGNINDTILLQNIFSTYAIDTVVHFAAESHVDRSIASPAEFIETNVLGTVNLLNAAKKSWVNKKDSCRFHHISTDEVYGSLEKNDPAFTEKNSYQPRSPYSASKAASDHLVRAFGHTYGLPFTISNCSNNYGPYQHAEKFIPTVIHACINQTEIPIYGNGSNIRDWLFVGDHCDAISRIIRYSKLGETYNIGGECEISNLDLATMICHLMDALFPAKKSHIHLLKFVTDRLGHDWRYAINNKKIKKTLQWKPITEIRTGLEKTIIFFTTLFQSSLQQCPTLQVSHDLIDK